MFLQKINMSHKLLYKELNEQFNPGEEANPDRFVEYIVNIPKNLEIYVLKNNENEILGCGTLIIEQKMIHNCSKVGHIEDVFIRNQFRGNGYREYLIINLQEIAKKANCYKVILDCDTKLEGFYKKNGFESKNIQMSVYF